MTVFVFLIDNFNSLKEQAKSLKYLLFSKSEYLFLFVVFFSVIYIAMTFALIKTKLQKLTFKNHFLYVFSMSLVSLIMLILCVYEYAFCGCVYKSVALAMLPGIVLFVALIALYATILGYIKVVYRAQGEVACAFNNENLVNRVKARPCIFIKKCKLKMQPLESPIEKKQYLINYNYVLYKLDKLSLCPLDENDGRIVGEIREKILFISGKPLNSERLKILSDAFSVLVKIMSRNKVA